MATNYPSSLDSFINPASTDTLNSATVPHAAQHDNINDAVLAVETALGANLSNVVLPARSISTTAPLTGGGDLSANRTLAVSAGSTSAAGVLQLTDSTSSTSTTTAATPNAVKTAYDLAIIKNPIVKQQSGTYLRTPMQIQVGATATNQRVYYTPIFVPTSTSYDRLAIRTSSTFVGSSIVRLGIFNDANGSPSTVVLDAGTLSCTTANTNYEITISQSLNAGFYWLAFCQQTAATTSSYVGAIASGASYQNYYLLTQATPDANGIAGLIQSSVSGAFSTATSLSASTSVCYTWIRAS